ncbi:MAG: hypothetical protein PF508_07570 [Spirochaeta sp.]|jgi:menaquinone-dependent protoporphyrinogen IX oxidase|nr:hypothetical protein [Spirochaeta sp.]
MILYASKYGSVREYVTWIQAQVPQAESPAQAAARSWDVKTDKRLAREALENAPADEPILILAPVYAGQIHGAVKALVGEYSDTLRRHPLALGLTSLYQGEQAREELMNCYPPALVAHAHRQFLIGGRIRPTELPFVVRTIVKKITGNSEDIDTLNREMAADIAAWLREPATAGPPPADR